MQEIRAAQSLITDDFSLEMTGKDIPALEDARGIIPPGTRINVTYLANEDLEMRVAAAQAVKEAGFVPIPHISARRLTSQPQLEEFLDRLSDVHAVEHVFVVGGDPSSPEGPYDSALDVIRSGILPDFGVREVSIAGYPEGHPDINDELLWKHLGQKTAALREQSLGSTVLTQFGFDTAPVVEWIRGVRDRKIDGTLRIGTPGPAGIKRLLSFARRFGIGANATIVKKYGFSLSNLMGTAGPERFVTQLAEALSAEMLNENVNLHMYAFGGLRPTVEWVGDYQAKWTS